MVAHNCLCQSLKHILQVPLCHINRGHFDDFFYFVDEEHLFSRVGDGPVSEQELHNSFAQVIVFLDKLSNAILKLLMVGREGVHLVEGQESLLHEVFMFILQRGLESVDN